MEQQRIRDLQATKEVNSPRIHYSTHTREAAITSETKGPFWRTAAEYGVITVSIWIMVVGIYFFKFPSHFVFGGVTGFSTVASEISRWSASDFTFIVNTSLPVLGFIFLGKEFGIKAVYANMVMSISLPLLERVCPLSRPLTTESLPELLLAIFLPAAGIAILFNLGASSGGIDIVATISKKYTSLNIGTVPMLVDVAAMASLSFIFGPGTGLFSTVGLAARPLVIDDVIENLNLYKCFNIICDDLGPICDYIINTLHRSVTVYHIEGAFTHHEKMIIMTIMKRSQALKLCNYIRVTESTAFMLISNSSEIIGKRFLAG